MLGGALACAAAAVLSGCTRADDPVSEYEAAEAPEMQRSAFVTACGGTSAGWQAAGVVSNRDAVEHRYLVVVSFLTPESAVLERTSTEVVVPPGATQGFTTETRLDPVTRPETVQCVLRGVEQL